MLHMFRRRSRTISIQIHCNIRQIAAAKIKREADEGVIHVLGELRGGMSDSYLLTR